MLCTDLAKDKEKWEGMGGGGVAVVKEVINIEFHNMWIFIV
jgi:hypothetical protein